MGILDRLERVDRRWVFLLMGIAVILPFVRPIGVTIKPSPPARGFHEAIESLPEGSTIYLAADLDPGSQAELLPMLEAFARQACRKHLDVVIACLWPAAPPLVEEIFNEIAVGEYGWAYGENFVHLGFKEGREAVMVMVAQRIAAAYPKDYYGTDLAELPLMQRIGGLADVDLLVSISAGYPGTKEWVQQVRSRYDIQMVSGCTAVSAPEYYPYVQSGQLAGLLGGLAGAAEYETLNGTVGLASRGMVSQSFGHAAVALFILAGNALHFATRRRRSP